jgi:polyferredoxin
MNDQNRSRKTLAILRKIRWLFVVGIGGILANSYYKVFSTKEIYGGILKSGCVPFLNCHACPTAFSSCPIGILQTFASQSIRKIPYFVLGFLGVFGLTVGRAACGWLCPFGWLQDVMHRIKSPKYAIAKSFLKLKYVILVVLVLILPYFLDSHWFSRFCPVGTLIAGIPWVIWNPVRASGITHIGEGWLLWFFSLKVLILFFFLALFVFYKRPFCRTVCPLGAIYALFNRISLMRMEVTGKCNDCSLCKQVCPMDIHIARDPDSPECIRCLECTVCKQVRVTWGIKK